MLNLVLRNLKGNLLLVIFYSIALGYIVWENFKELFERKLKEDEDERELREAFRVLDKQNKGTIPVDDLRWILQSLGDDLTEEELDDMINETDTDGSGTVDYEGKLCGKLDIKPNIIYMYIYC